MFSRIAATSICHGSYSQSTWFVHLIQESTNHLIFWWLHSFWLVLSLFEIHSMCVKCIVAFQSIDFVYWFSIFFPLTPSLSRFLLLNCYDLFEHKKILLALTIFFSALLHRHCIGNDDEHLFDVKCSIDYNRFSFNIIEPFRFSLVIVQFPSEMVFGGCWTTTFAC